MLKFEPSTLDLITTMIEPYLRLKPELADQQDIGKPFRFKFANNAEGTSPDNLKLLSKVSAEILAGKYNNETPENKLLLIDALTLISNHVDQHSKETKFKKLPKDLKESTVLHFLTAAYQLMKTMDQTHDLETVIQQGNVEKLSSLNPRVLSTMAQTAHYYGKALRYNSSLTHENTLPHLTFALLVANLLDKNPSAQDIHGYTARQTTYEMPLIYAYRQTGQFSEAISILNRQIKESEKGQDAFPLVQAIVQTAQIYTEMGEPAKGVATAQQAVSLTEVSFKNHVLYFNAQEALMKSYQASGETDKAKTVACHVLDRYEHDNNCGAKEDHLKNARKMLEANKNTI